ncbi:hypothetical protein MTO96_005694 [Rhipicephalus appendiculatus]
MTSALRRIRDVGAAALQMRIRRKQQSARSIRGAATAQRCAPCGKTHLRGYSDSNRVRRRGLNSSPFVNGNLLERRHYPPACPGFVAVV